VLLSLTLIIGTLNILLKYNNPTSTYIRRDIGIFGGILTLIHSVIGLFAHMRGNMWQYFLIKTEYGYSIRLDDFGIANYTGVISTMFIIVLILISNDYSLKKFKTKRGKNIQRLSHIMFIFAIIHVIYYRVILKKLDSIYYTYLMLLVIVLIFQIIGFSLRIKRKFIT
jgi:methionine sulfoxide reductase heme-binding subunit